MPNQSTEPSKEIPINISKQLICFVKLVERDAI
jgi:hypothetical protein